MISNNPSVKKFAIELIKQFQQLEATTTLVSLLKHDDQDLAVMASDALSELGIHQYADEIVELGRNNMHHEKRTISIIKSLGKIGNVNHKPFLAFHMIHGSYKVRFEAIKALLKLKVSVLDQFVDFNINHDSEFDAMFKHLTDPLLK
jgi:HEAT repeat protein